MSSNANPSPTISSGTSRSRSIPDVIAERVSTSKSRKSADDDESAVLVAAEDHHHLQELKLQELELLEECRQWKRESEINNGKLNEIARDLIVMTEKEKNTINKYELLLDDIWVAQKHKEEIFHKLQEEKVSYTQTMASLEETMREKDEEIGKLEEENNRLKSEMGDLKGTLREKEDEIKGLVDDNNRAEREKKEIEADSEIQLEELKLVRRMNERLEEEKGKFRVQMEELRKLEREKDDKVKELIERNVCLEMEKGEIMRADEYGEKIKELEEQVANWMLANVGRVKRLGGTRIQQFLSGIVKALDFEETSVTCKNDGNFQNAVEDGATCTDKVASSGVIHISDSDSDVETPLHGSGQKRKRTLIETQSDRSSSDDSLNPKNKTKKLKDVLPEPVKHEPPVAAMSGSRKNLKFVTPDQRQTKGVVRKCNEKLEKVKESRCQDHDRSTPADSDCSPEIEEYISSLSKKKTPKVQRI